MMQVDRVTTASTIAVVIWRVLETAAPAISNGAGWTRDGIGTVGRLDAGRLVGHHFSPIDHL